MAVILGLAVALSYGAADFLGGVATKRSPVWAVIVASQLFGLALVGALMVVAGGQPTGSALALGSAAGAFGGVGLACLYRGLATGRMSVVAPITAVGAAVVPLVWGLGRGERPSRLALTGAVVAVVAVALISRSPDAGAAAPDGAGAGSSTRSILGLAVVSGAAFGAVFVVLGETGDGVGFWPLVAGRVTSIVLIGATAVLLRQSLAPASGSAPTILGAGALDITANAVFLLATRRGLLSLVAVISALYPAGTVLLARVVLDERLHRIQVAGLGLALTGIVLIAAG